MTTQDTVLVEVVARVLYEYHKPKHLDWLAIWPSERGYYFDVARESLQAILPHLSPESQALLRKELGDG